MALLLAAKSVSLVRAAAPELAAARAADAPAAAQAAPAPPPPPAPAAHAADPPVSDSERQLLLDLRARRRQLDAQEAALAGKEAVLDAAQARLGARVAELTTLQQRLQALEKDRASREDAGWQGLVKLYEAMKPRDAATIFDDMDQAVLLQLLDRMRETKAAPVLAAMQADRARQVTAELARLRERRNRLAAPAASGS